jgi:hypothetical protein
MGLQETGMLQASGTLAWKKWLLPSGSYPVSWENKVKSQGKNLLNFTPKQGPVPPPFSHRTHSAQSLLIAIYL